MAQADLLVDLVRSASNGDQVSIRKVSQNLIQEEKSKGHSILAERLTKAMTPEFQNNNKIKQDTINTRDKELFFETIPERSLDSLILPDKISRQMKELIEEQHRSDLLHSYNLNARNRVLLAGPPGNGKTTLAEALAYELMYPLIVVRYETLIGSYLGETSGRLRSLLDYAKTQRCVLFFDEFDTIAKERGDTHETGEIKRVVSSLLLQIDSLPDYVVIVAASNHQELLDRAVWRRFQIRIELLLPTRAQLNELIQSVGKRCKVDFGYAPETLAKYLKGLNFAEAEDFCLDIVRQAILNHKSDCAKSITKTKLDQWRSKLKPNKE